MHDLNAEEQQIVDVVARFVDSEVRPVAAELEHSDTYPAALIEAMQAMGVFGLVIPLPLTGRPPCRRRASPAL